MLGERAYNSWLHDALICCCPTTRPRHVDETSPRDHVVERRIHHQQPRLVQPPIFDPPPGRPSTSKELLAKGRSYAASASKRGAFAVRRRLNAYNGITSRKPPTGQPMQISGPSEFQHVAMALPRPQIERFRPLQLSIYMPENRLSPILSHFGEGEDSPTVAYPPQAVISPHSRSMSEMSYFTIPRKPLIRRLSVRMEKNSVRDSVEEHESHSSSTSEWALQPLKPPPRIPESASTQELMAALEAQLPKAPPTARLRSATDTSRLIKTAEQYGRVKSALIERQELDDQLKKIDMILEQRRSLYLKRCSRGPSIYTIPKGEEPLFSVASAREVFTPNPSKQQSKTACSSPVIQIPHRATSFTDASAAFNSHPPMPRENSNSHSSTRRTPPVIPVRKSSSQHSSSGAFQPPPPLPLSLHSPQQSLHNSVSPRKSFSRSRRVSNWLFPSSATIESADEEKEQGIHRIEVSSDSVTNSPHPITSKQGFYQCIDYSARQHGGVNESASSVMTGRSIDSASEDKEKGDAVFESEGDGDEGTRTAGTTIWSPTSSPGLIYEGTTMALSKEMDVHVAVACVEGGKGSSATDMRKSWAEEKIVHVGPTRTSVGVAF